MSVQIQRFATSNETSKMSRSRLPLQPRHPNAPFPSTSTTTNTMGDDASSRLHSSSTSSDNNSNNKARLMDSASSRNLAYNKTNSLGGTSSSTGYPVEIGNEYDSSLVVNTGASTGGVPPMRIASSRSLGVGSFKNSSSSSSLVEKPSTASNNNNAKSLRYPESDQDITIEEKRKRINGDGYTIHRYIRGRLLGKGGFAKVYVCTALDTNKQYAVKVVPKANLVKTRARQKLQAEIKIHRTLKHNNVCEYKHFFEDRTNCYILLELCHNQSMNEMIKRRKRVSEPEAAYFMHQLLESVHYLHQQCVIHRDLKLGNLFLDRNMNIKVGDFGLATRLESVDEKRKTICGTPNYIAPEVIQGTKETRGHSFEVDVWSMGVILFTVLFGKPPYEAKDVKATYQRIIANEYSFPPHISVSNVAKDLIVSMLQSDPRDRPTLQEICEHPFLINPAPTSLPSSVTHLAPSFEFGEDGIPIAIGRGQHDSAKAPLPRSSMVSRQPFATQDSNAAAPLMTPQDMKEVLKTEKRHQEGRDSVQERVKAVLAPAARPLQFEIFDEQLETKSQASSIRAPSSTAKSVASSKGISMESVLARTAALSVNDNRKMPPPPTPPPVFIPTDDTDILKSMLGSLSTALDVAEERKFTYGQPSSSARPTSRGGPAVWVTKHVDYTSKYGLGFLLNNGSSGVYFNDSTKAVLEALGETFQYVERRKVDGGEPGFKRNDPICETHTLTDFPDSLQKKVTLLKHFRSYLNDQQKLSPDNDEIFDVNDEVTLPLTYLKKWVRTKHAILFRLSNHTVQIVFYDNTEVLMTPDPRFVTYCDKRGGRSTYYLNDDLVGTNPELAKRLKYSKEILHQLLNGGSGKQR